MDSADTSAQTSSAQTSGARTSGAQTSTAELHRRALAAFADRAADIRSDQWTAPTPCADWDVHALVNHIVNENRWTVPLLAGATIDEVGSGLDGDLLGTDPIGSLESAVARAEAAVAQPGALNRTVHLSFGDTPAEEYAWQLLADHLIHAWDLAAAIGADTRLDLDLVQACAGWFAGREDLYRQAGAIGARIPVPEDADDQERLLATFGRDSAWKQ
jgi:uncharacterized protein (TIGR03086 family)